MSLKGQISIKKDAKKADSRIFIVWTNLLQRKNQAGVLNIISIVVVTCCHLSKYIASTCFYMFYTLPSIVILPFFYVEIFLLTRTDNCKQSNLP